jgi:hypothetical protein
MLLGRVDCEAERSKCAAVMAAIPGIRESERMLTFGGSQVTGKLRESDESGKCK